MKTPLPLTIKGVTSNFIKKMLRAKHLLVLLALSAGLLFNASKAFSQTTTNESFESGPQDGTTFTSNGQVFNIGSNVSGPFVFDLLAGYGWNGTTADNWLIDNYSSYSTVSPSFFINSATTFKVNSFWVQLLADLPPPRLSGGTLVVSGSLAGNPVYTETFSSGFNTDINTNNGYTQIALTGTDAGKVIDKITISADNLIFNIVLDAFNWTSTATTTVTSITNAGASPTNAASVDYTVTFGSAVTGLSASNFTLTTTGVTGAAVGTPTSSDGGVTWTVPVTTGTGDGTIILNLANGAGLSKALTTTLPFVGSTYTIDKTPPTVVSINRVGTSPNNAVTDQFTVTFSEAVTGVDITDFSLTNTGATTGTIASVTGTGTTYTVTVNTVAGDGTMRLDLNPGGTGIIDAATNPIAGGFTTGQVYSIDQTAPTVTISAPSVAATVVGPVTYTITYSDANFNTSTLTVGDIILNATGTATGTVGLTGSGLTYTVTISGISGSGTLGISIPSGTATDLAGNLAPPAGPSATFTVTPVTIVSLTKTDASPTNAASVSYTATFSSAVTGLTASNFSLTTTGTLAGTSIGTPTTTDGGLTWTVAVNTGTGDGNLTLNLANSTGVTPPITSTLPFAGDTYIIDKTAPAIAISAPSATSATTGPITYTITYSDANFGTSALTAGDITLNTTGTAAGTVGVTGSGLTYTVTISGISGTGSLGISIAAGTATDLAGNTAGAAGPSATFTVAPANTTIVALTKTGASPTNAASVSYTATFGAAVTGLTASNFSLTTTGTLAGTSIGTPTTTDGGLTWTVTVNTGTGDGNLTLNLANATGLTPGISTTLPFVGDTYIIDKTAPAIAISAPSATSTNTGPITYTVTYSDANFGTSALTAGDITLNTTGTAAGTVGVTGSGTTYTVTISAITGMGSLGISIAAGTATDLAGNTAGAAGPSATFTVTPPNTTIVSLTKTGASPTNAATVSYTATFGAAITGLTAANFSVTTTGTLAGTSVGTPTTTDGGLTWTVTVNTGSGDGNLTLNLANATGLTPGISTTLPFAGDTYTIDKTPPVVASINTVGATSNTASSEQFTVTFSEAVTGADISDFSLVNTGSVAGTISGISGSGSVYTVTISGVSGNGTMKLNLKNSGTGIADIAGNPIATGFTTGQVYILGDATNAAITTLTIFPGTLSPAFDPATKAYTAEVTNATQSVAITVTAISGATIAINGAAVAQGSPEQVALNIGNNTINVVITAPDGTTTATYTIVVYRGEAITSISATNILTPNGDGKNDLWVIKDIELYPNNLVTVYDKAGRIVFSKRGYTNDWGGTYNGSPLAQGTYYYTVDLGTYLRRFTGYISIVKN